MKRLHLLATACAAALLAACDVPTDVPKWDMTWSVPSKSTSISVNSMLPTGVSAQGSSFYVNMSGVSIIRALGQDCSACQAADGLTIPKPAFTGTGTATVALPASVLSAALGTTTISVAIQHTFGFDPLRPSAAAGAATGWIRLVVTSGGVVIGRDSINGATTALPTGPVLLRSIPLTGTVSATDGVVVTSTISSPAGDPVQMIAARTMIFAVQNPSLTVTSAQVRLTNQAVNAAATSMDLSGVDGAIRDRAMGGTLFLTIANPFSVTGALTLTFVGSSPAVSKSINLSAGNSTPSVVFTADELKALLGKNINLTVTGTVSGNPVSVQPSQTVSVGTRLQVTLNSASN